MIKYLFTKDEMCSLLYLCGGTDYKCNQFDVLGLTQEIFDTAVEGLFEKGVLFKENNKDIRMDLVFERILQELYNANYTIEKKGFAAGIGEIIVVLETDPRNEEIIKLTPIQNPDMLQEVYEIPDDSEFTLYTGAGERGIEGEPNLSVQNTFAEIKELIL